VCIDTRDFEIGVPSIVNMENGISQPERNKTKRPDSGHPTYQFLHHHYGAGQRSQIQFDIIVYQIVNMDSNKASIIEEYQEVWGSLP
jgi:hypothetical protein